MSDKMRYKDMELIKKELFKLADDMPKEYCDAIIDCINTIDNIPTSDVVPKSEVEALKHEIERIIDEGEYWQGKYLVARSTVAREIFEDIEKYYKEKIYLLMDMPTYLAELKNKYTESEDTP